MSSNNEGPSTASPLEEVCDDSRAAEVVGDDKREEEKSKYPPMPCSNTGDCRPAWLCSPIQVLSKLYPVPAGVTIIPISQGGRFGTPSDVVSSPGVNDSSTCGRSDDGMKKDPTEPNKDCPMMKPRCPANGNGWNIFAYFCGGSTKEEEPKEILEAVPTVVELESSLESPPTEDAGGDNCQEAVEEVPQVEGAGPTEDDSEVPEFKPAEDFFKDCEPKPIEDPQAFLNQKCGCSLCKKFESEEPLNFDFLPEADDRHVTVRAKELMEECCSCPNCTTLPLCDEDGEPIPVRCPNVTCGECGYVRGENLDCCLMCRFAVAMKEEGEYMRNTLVPCDCEEEEVAKKCAPEVDPDTVPFEWANGKPVYEGGMSIVRAQRYLWQNGLCDGEGFRALAIEGQRVYTPEEEAECTCEEHMKKLKYQGGMTLEERQEWLWIKNKFPSPPEPSEEELQALEAPPGECPEWFLTLTRPNQYNRPRGQRNVEGWR